MLQNLRHFKIFHVNIPQGLWWKLTLFLLFPLAHLQWLCSRDADRPRLSAGGSCGHVATPRPLQCLPRGAQPREEDQKDS